MRDVFYVCFMRLLDMGAAASVPQEMNFKPYLILVIVHYLMGSI